MIIMHLFDNMKSKKNKKLYDTTVQLIEQKNISNLRKRLKILVVDDEDDAIYEVLKERQYEVYYKNDMTYAIETEPFDLILMDVRGIAKRLKSSMEGFALACEVKSKYPLKKVCCYSASVHKEITELLADNRIDAYFMKDLDVDKICNKIDNLIQDYVDIDKQWEVLRSILIDNQINENDIQQIKTAYSEMFKKNDFSKLNEIIAGTMKNATVLLNITASILNLIKVLAV